MNIRCRSCGTVFPLVGNPGDIIACPGCGKEKKVPSTEIARPLSDSEALEKAEPTPAKQPPNLPVLYRLIIYVRGSNPLAAEQGLPPIWSLLKAGAVSLVVFLLLAVVYRGLYRDSSSPPDAPAASVDGSSSTDKGPFDVARDTPAWGTADEAEEVAQTVATTANDRPLEDEWRAAYEIVKRGGRIGVPHRQEAFADLIKAALSATDRNLHVVAIELSGPNHTDENLTALSRLPHLTRLDLSQIDPDTVTDVGFRHVSELAKLEYLDVSNLKISRQAVTNFANMKRLRVLRLANTRLNDDGLSSLSNLVALEDLDVSNTKIKPEGLSHLRALSKLRRLNLRGTSMTTEGLSHLSPLTTLEDLYLPKPAITAVAALGTHFDFVAAAAPRSSAFVTDREIAAQAETVRTFIDYAMGLEHLAPLKRLNDIRMLFVFGAYDEMGGKLAGSERWTATFREIPVEIDYSSDIVAPDISQMRTPDNAFRYLLAYRTSGRRGGQDLKAVRVKLLRRDSVGRMFFDEAAPSQLSYINQCQNLITLLTPHMARPSGSLLRHIQDFTKVTSLDLSGISLRDDDLRNLSNLTALQVLDLGGSPITGQGLSHLKTLKNLKYLRLTGTSVTDKDLTSLVPLERLTDVVLTQTNVTENGIDRIASDMPRLKVTREPSSGQPWWVGFDWESFSDGPMQEAAPRR